MKTIIEILAEGLRKHGLNALVIGGHALPAYGVVRQTLDVDCLMPASDRGPLEDILIEAGYIEAAVTDNFVRYTHASIYLMDLDVVFVDQKTFEKMETESSPYRFGETELNVPSLSHIVALKLHAIKNDPERELKDMGDIIELLKSNKGHISASSLQTICDRYGPKDTFYRLKEYL